MMQCCEDPWVYRARLIRVVDGDTYIFQIDHGMRIYSEQSVRLMGVDTPEIFRGDEGERRRGQEAKRLAEHWFATNGGTGERFPFCIRTEKDKQSFNRYVASIWSNVTDRNLADDLAEWIEEQGWTKV